MIETLLVWPPADVIALLVGIAGVAIAIYAARVARRALAIEESRRAEELEARRRARVVARFSKRWDVRGKRHVSLVLVNKGQAPARNVSVELAPLDGGHFDTPPALEAALPIAQLGPDELGAFPLTLGYQEAAHLFEAVVEWDDDAGEGREAYVLRD